MPAALYLPRRHRRHLLFPPGLLALAGLLWLGCVAVPMIKPVQPRQAIIEVAFPQLHASAGSPFTFPTVRELEKFGPWRSITISGNLWADYFDVRVVENACLSLVEEQLQHRALHVYLNESTSYNTFIQLLDIPNRLAIKRYWIDWRKLPYSFNLLGNIPPNPNYLSFSCGTSYMNNSSSQYLKPIPLRPFTERAQEWFVEQLTEYRAAILSPVWRNTWLLLLLLAALSAWKLTRLRAAYRY